MIPAIAAGVVAAHGGSAPPAFSYDDIPDQLLRINSLEGSLAFSGSVLTGVTDVSSAGETCTFIGSPTYTASDADLNGAPSFTASQRVVAPNVDRSSIRFVAVVLYRTSNSNQLVIDADESTTRFFINMAPSGALEHSSGTIAGITGAVGRKRMLIPNDGVTPVMVNGSASSSLPVGSAAGIGVTLGMRFDGTVGGSRIAFMMLCGAVPSAPLLTALEAKLLEDFG